MYISCRVVCLANSRRRLLQIESAYPMVAGLFRHAVMANVTCSTRGPRHLTQTESAFFLQPNRDVHLVIKSPPPQLFPSPDKEMRNIYMSAFRCVVNFLIWRCAFIFVVPYQVTHCVLTPFPTSTSTVHGTSELLTKLINIPIKFVCVPGPISEGVLYSATSRIITRQQQRTESSGRENCTINSDTHESNIL